MWKHQNTKTQHTCNEWKTEKRHECTNTGKVKRLELLWQTTSRHFRSGTYEISGRLIFVEQSVHVPRLNRLDVNVTTDRRPAIFLKLMKFQIFRKESNKCYVYIFLLTCMLCSVYSLPTGILRLPD
jgi:hypothetical protein